MIDIEEEVSTDDLKKVNETECQWEHVHSVCSVEVRWLVPANPCNHEGPTLACDNAHTKWMSYDPRQPVICRRCGDRFRVGDIQDWRPV